MKQRFIAFAVLILFAAFLAPAQSLKDNQYLKKSTELRAQADRAFEEGDYDGAAKLAAQAAEFAKLSNEFVETSIIKLDAERALRKADAAFTRAMAADAPARRPAEYAAAAGELVAAREAYGAAEYKTARNRALAAAAACDLIAKADASDGIAAAEEMERYLKGVGAAELFPDLLSSGGYELVAARDAFGRQDWATAENRARGASISYGKAVAADAEAAIARAFDDLAWARSIGAPDLYPDAFAQASETLSTALDAQAEGDLRAAAAAARVSLTASAEVARLDATDAIARAKDDLAWALGVSAEYPAEFDRALVSANDAEGAFARARWRVASERARASTAIVAEIARSDAGKAIAGARELLGYAQDIGAPERFPDDFAAAEESLVAAGVAYAAEDWQAAGSRAREASRVLEAIAKADAQDAIDRGSELLAWAQGAGAPTKYATSYDTAAAALERARAAFGDEDWRSAAGEAREAAGILEGIALAMADAAIERAKEWMAWAEGMKAPEVYPELYGLASAAMEGAAAAYEGEDWRSAVAEADDAASILIGLARALADAAIGSAKEKMAWAEGIEAPKYYPDGYGEAQAAMGAARAAYEDQDWRAAAANADVASAILDVIAMAEADALIAQAKEWLDWASGIEAPKNYPAEYGSSGSALAEAEAAYGLGEWLLAADKARRAIAALAGVGPVEEPPAVVVPVEEPPAIAKIVLPGSYVVRLIPGRRDCLWRIAEYPFVYNDPLKWPLLYEANKKTFKDPANPNLIHPGQVLNIPALGEEERSGAYDPKIAYPDLPKVK